MKFAEEMSESFQFLGIPDRAMPALSGKGGHLTHPAATKESLPDPFFLTQQVGLRDFFFLSS